MSNSDLANIIDNAEEPEEALEQVIERLSKSPKLEYEMQRKSIADKFDIRVSVLDDAVEKARPDSLEEPKKEFLDIEPWPEPIDGSALLNEIRNEINRFIICAPETANASALWIAFTWFIDSVEVAPIAFITAPEMQCGKSQLLSLMGLMVQKPAIASNITPSVIFRVIEDYCPTLLIDEADSFVNGNEELRGLINSGHTRDTAFSWRNEKVGETYEPKRFSTWGAKALCGIGTQAATIMDRAIILQLRRKLADEKTDRLRHANKNDFLIIRRKLARLKIDAEKTIALARPQLPEALSDRAQDNWEPLIAIADYASKEWGDTARQTALTINAKTKDEDNQSAGIMLLNDIQDIFEEEKYLTRISSAELSDRLHNLEDRPWGDWFKGKPITTNKIARYLKPFGVAPQTIRLGTRTAKGYQKDAFEDAVSRYLPNTTVTPSQVSDSNDYSSTSKRNTAPIVTDEKPIEPPENIDCYDVTDRETVAWPLD